MSSFRFNIKICGVTVPDAAVAAARAGATAIGLNFYPQSKRYVSLPQAVEIGRAIPNDVAKVGVFVNPSTDFVFQTLERLPLDFLQFHGEETPEFLAQFGTIPLIKAFRWHDGIGDLMDSYLRQCTKLQCTPQAILIDSNIAGEYGGTGMTADWNAVAKWRRQQANSISIVLAGGLTPANVASAIEIVRPDAVDTASGVETCPGQKDEKLMQSFVAAATLAFSNATD